MTQETHRPGSSALFSLDEPRPAHARERWLWIIGILAYAVMITVIAVQGSQLLAPVIWVPVAHAIVVAAACGFTAVIVLGQATGSGRRGYLILGGTYLYVSLLLCAFPFLFPGAIVAEGPLVGGVQSSISIFYSWHIMFLVGLIASIEVLWRDQRHHRRPGLPIGVPQVVLIVVSLAMATVVLAVAQPITFLAETGELTSAGLILDFMVLGLAGGAVLLALMASRRGAQIQRWLLAVSLLLLGEAVINVFAEGRWSVAWYFNRLFGMIALAVLFSVLLMIISRLGRATNTLASGDPLTGCESRASFSKSLHRGLARGQSTGTPGALLWIDLDGFKSVNDQLGHEVGDDVLRAAVLRIQQQVRAGDHVGRLGGDEFGVLLCDHVGDTTADAIAERILLHLREPVIIGVNTVLLSGSIGIASAGPAHSAAQLLHEADLAMYAAKNNGGDRYQRFDGDLGLDARDRAELRHQLTRGIREGAFDLDFQPIINLTDGTVVGAEALARWQRDGTRLSADQFIDFAVNTGQITSIGRLIVRRLEAELPHMLGRLPSDGFVSVNLSVRELVDADIVTQLRHGPLAAHAKQLVLEITESTELQSMAEAEANLALLRYLGYRVALDDFGAGFSNFSRLEQLQPHIIKVDKTLIARAGQGQKGGEAFMAAAVSVADSLGCVLVAEGVQTPSEEAVVRQLGIPLVQGFRFGRPQPHKEWPTP